ncbi:large subunit of -dimethylformamidase protein [Colletotrichum sp. SAR11_59]|nr:large subunit of -dimethylformamidase protein [Colletotrichum sp. SAR11_59]
MAAGFFFDTTASAPHATKVFNGRLDSPHIQITRDGVSYITWAKFDFSLDMSSDRVIDTSGNANHGDLINAPTRAVKGFNWDGSEPDWTKARYGYGAIHFHDDDLDDAAWTTDFTLKVPTNALSGAYAVIVRSVDPSADVSDHITFFVRPATTSSADIAVPKVAIVLSTFTYLAYANEHMYDQSRASRMTLAGGVQVRKDALWRRMARRTDLGCSLYDVHNDGSGCVFSTAKRPILNIRPGYVNWAFHRPQSETGIEEGNMMDGFVIGTKGFGGGASGDEIDRMDVRLGTPINTILLATSTGHDDSFGVFNEEMMFPMVDTVGTKCEKVRSDMIVYETCGGGSVFSVGSINWYCSLGWDKYQNNVARITWNVLREFMRRGGE